jgi:tRNA threonylcarbamoyladenosine biosynthesis protein TsaE
MSVYKAIAVNDLTKIAQQLIVDFGTTKVVVFAGEMGAGKTTLIKQICKQLGVEEATTSPTFSIVNEYLTNNNQSIYHFDFYRIDDETEVFDLGYEDYFYGGAFCFIEWPEKIPNLLPETFVKVIIELDEQNNRLISVVR